MNDAPDIAAEVRKNDRERLKKIRPLTIKGVRLFLDMYDAVSNGDAAGAKTAYAPVRDCLLEVQAILRLMGTESAP